MVSTCLIGKNFNWLSLSVTCFDTILCPNYSFPFILLLYLVDFISKFKLSSQKVYLILKFKCSKIWFLRRGGGDTWHVTPDTWHMLGGEHYFKTSAPKLLRFEIENSKRKDDLMKEWINEKGVYWTAPATTGLLNTIQSLWRRGRGGGRGVLPRY